MNVTEEHLHRMARRHHATMQKLDGIREEIAEYSNRAFSTIETGGGAWVGGLMDGKLQWPVSAGAVFGVGFILLDFLDFGGEKDSARYGNIGKGFLAGPLARVGYRFGQHMRERRSARPQGAL